MEAKRRTLREESTESKVNRFLELLRSPELHATEIEHGAAISLLSTWSEPPIEILRALYFIDMLWGSAPGKNALLEIVYNDYLDGNLAKEELDKIIQDMGEPISSWDKQRKYQLHRRATLSVIKLYESELKEVQRNWEPSLPEHERGRNVVKFLRSHLSEELKKGTPWELSAPLEIYDFIGENSEAKLRERHLELKAKQFFAAMGELEGCFRGPTGALSNLRPVAEYLGDGEMARSVLGFTQNASRAHGAMRGSGVENKASLRYAPMILNCHNLNLESMSQFYSLLEEYNEEWALAAMEWE